MVKKREAEIPVTASSGNVFADMGLPEPEEELTKAQLASHIRQVIKRQRLTQVAAAALMGIDQPKVSALLNGRLANFSSERLMRLLTALGQDVDITVRKKPRNRAARPHPCRRRGACAEAGTWSRIPTAPFNTAFVRALGLTLSARPAAAVRASKRRRVA